MLSPASDPSADGAFQLLTELYREEKEHVLEGPVPGHSGYLDAHSRGNSINRHLSVFRRYLPHIPASGAVLDWGCRQAPDSCLLRHELGADLRLYGCDFEPPDAFPAFHRYAGLDYTQLTTTNTLPYEDEAFDAVIGSGVIEHTADDSVALRELHRVMRDDAILVLTFIPNHHSYTEFLSRRIRPARAHARRYTRRDIRQLVLHRGFVPVALAYHQMVPGQAGPAWVQSAWRANEALERAWPLNRLASNLMIVCRRQSIM